MSVTVSPFGSYKLYTIKNSSGSTVSVTDLGAAVQSIVVCDRYGNFGDVVLGFDTPEDYLSHNDYFGATVGRYANRIRGAAFTLNGCEYKLTANEGCNTLHGGVGFSKRRFELKVMDYNSVTLCLADPDGADGFPGALDFSVRFQLTESNSLAVSYRAVSDKDTVLSFTNHSYFNLAGKGDILSHELRISADSYLPLDDENLPTGEVRAVDGTDFDFRQRRQIKFGHYDHCFVLNDPLCAELYEPLSGRKLEVITDRPAVQIYAAGATPAGIGKSGVPYGKNSGLAIETQAYPNSPNEPSFPSTVLRADEEYLSISVYKFSTED